MGKMQKRKEVKTKSYFSSNITRKTLATTTETRIQTGTGLGPERAHATKSRPLY